MTSKFSFSDLSDCTQIMLEGSHDILDFISSHTGKDFLLHLNNKFSENYPGNSIFFQLRDPNMEFYPEISKFLGPGVHKGSQLHFLSKLFNLNLEEMKNSLIEEKANSFQAEFYLLLMNALNSLVKLKYFQKKDCGKKRYLANEIISCWIGRLRKARSLSIQKLEIELMTEKDRIDFLEAYENDISLSIFIQLLNLYFRYAGNNAEMTHGISNLIDFLYQDYIQIVHFIEGLASSDYKKIGRPIKRLTKLVDLIESNELDHIITNNTENYFEHESRRSKRRVNNHCHAKKSSGRMKYNFRDNVFRLVNAMDKREIIRRKEKQLRKDNKKNRKSHSTNSSDDSDREKLIVANELEEGYFKWEENIILSEWILETCILSDLVISMTNDGLIICENIFPIDRQKMSSVIISIKYSQVFSHLNASSCNLFFLNDELCSYFSHGMSYRKPEPTTPKCYLANPPYYLNYYIKDVIDFFNFTNLGDNQLISPSENQIQVSIIPENKFNLSIVNMVFNHYNAKHNFAFSFDNFIFPDRLLEKKFHHDSDSRINSLSLFDAGTFHHKAVKFYKQLGIIILYNEKYVLEHELSQEEDEKTSFKALTLFFYSISGNVLESRKLAEEIIER